MTLTTVSELRLTCHPAGKAESTTKTSRDVCTSLVLWSKRYFVNTGGRDEERPAIQSLIDGVRADFHPSKWPLGRRKEDYFGKTTLSTPDRYLNLELPVIGSLVYRESSALGHEATKLSPSDCSKIQIFDPDSCLCRCNNKTVCNNGLSWDPMKCGCL
uniref:Uncharacterized protein n=1 Tax=Timema shepardi TaxID=629360 RepID=A0A7R9B1H1_TIMSH|nr:unnamed protein product [Timema shepardi]